MNFLRQVFKCNYTRFFSPPDFFNEDKDFYYSEKDSFCAQTIAYSLKNYGKRLILPVNITLFLIGLLLLSVDDYFVITSTSKALKLLLLSLAAGFMIIKFDAWKLFNAENLLKLGYILIVILTAGTVLLPYLFLVVYENVAARAKGRKNP